MMGKKGENKQFDSLKSKVKYAFFLKSIFYLEKE